MKLMTKELIAKLPPLYSNENNPNPAVVVKFFNPSGAGTWYVTEGEVEDDGDILFFGMTDLQEKEMGYFTLRELESMKCPPFGLGIERDMYFGQHKLNEFREIGEAGRTE